MDKPGFKEYLQKLGKKPSVIEGLMAFVEQFESHVNSTYNLGLENVNAQIIHDYACDPSAIQRVFSTEALRSLALYFRFLGDDVLATSASDLREHSLKKSRKSPVLKEFSGIDTNDLLALQGIDVRRTDQMLEAGKDAQARQKLSTQTGISRQVIFELVQLSDLARILWLKGIRARLYHDAGIDTIDK